MKYIRKIAIIGLVIIFLIGIAISVAVATRIKNINVTYYMYTGEGNEAYNQTLENLQDLKGGSIFTLSDNDVNSCLSDTSRLSLVSYEKSFPCTLEIVISERVETFYSYSDGVCYVYDSDGVLMYSSTDYEGNDEEGYLISQTYDLSPDVMIDYDLTQAENTFIAESCATFKQYFGALRGIVKSVYSEVTPESKNLVFELRSGLEIDIIDCGNLTDEKIAQAYSQYITLSDGQKTVGKIRVYTQGGTEQTITSVYIP